MLKRSKSDREFIAELDFRLSSLEDIVSEVIDGLITKENAKKRISDINNECLDLARKRWPDLKIEAFGRDR